MEHTRKPLIPLNKILSESLSRKKLLDLFCGNAYSTIMMTPNTYENLGTKIKKPRAIEFANWLIENHEEGVYVTDRPPEHYNLPKEIDEGNALRVIIGSKKPMVCGLSFYKNYNETEIINK